MSKVPIDFNLIIISLCILIFTCKCTSDIKQFELAKLKLKERECFESEKSFSSPRGTADGVLVQ